LPSPITINADYTTYKIVKALKGEPIKGYFQIKIGGQSKRFDQSNVVEFMPPLFQAVATKLNGRVRHRANSKFFRDG
jgi:hypothetical protein